MTNEQTQDQIAIQKAANQGREALSQAIVSAYAAMAVGAGPYGKKDYEHGSYVARNQSTIFMGQLMNAKTIGEASDLCRAFRAAHDSEKLEDKLLNGYAKIILNNLVAEPA